MVERDSAERSINSSVALIKKRKLAGKSPQKQINYAMQKVFPTEKSSLMGYLSEKKRVLEFLEWYKNEQKKEGKNLSRPALCAVFLNETVTDGYRDMARNLNSKDNIEKFRFLFDFAMGSELVLSSILMAESELSGRGEKARQQFLSFISNASDASTSDVAEEYLFFKKEGDSFLELLLKDPSGFLLLNNVVEKVKAGSDLHSSFCTKEYVLAGAEVSRDLYGKLYEIAAPLYPQGSSE